MTSKLISFASQNKAASAVVMIALAALFQRTVCKRASFCSSSRVEQKRVQEFKRASASTLPILSKDPTSFANIDEAVTRNFHLSLDADFDAKVLRGSVTLTLEARQEVKQIVLDTRDLSIFQVVDQNLNSLKFNLGKEHEAFGSPLTIQLKDRYQPGDVFKLLIEYETSPNASAIQWLPPAQTAGKKHPYLFTQCQAIHARSFFPSQDTPSIKTPYTASVSVPEELIALMSAVSQDSRPLAETKTRRKVYNFEQKVPMASYLVALAIGKLEKRDISHRCAVWSEAEMVEAGAFEFSETEDFLKTAESICGPYEWGRYDILLLPPSFPYGGMENPCLTFVTPTLLAGDRSLASVVAHEIAHSWMGNLVTSQTWEHFWLNEGWTVFVERKIIGALFGKQHAHLSAIIGWKSLRESISKFGRSHPYTVLNVQLKDVDPDDAFSSVPYEKGFNLLFHLEQVVGGDSVMAPFIKAYVLNFRNSTVTTESFKDFFLNYFSSRVKPEVLETIDWDNRFHAPGLPPTPTFDTTLSQAATDLAIELVKKNGEVSIDVDLKSWKSTQLVVFLEKLMDLQGDDKTEEQSFQVSDDSTAQWAKLLTKINSSIFPFAQSKNAEIRFRWLTMCVRANMESYYADAAAFLLSQGRMKFTRPLYSDLAKAKGGREIAVETFTKNRDFYHAICAKMVAKDLGLS